MGIFGDIWKKISDPWGVAEKYRQQKDQSGGAPAPSPAPSSSPSPSPASAAPAPTTASQPVDVEKVLDDMAGKRAGGGGNWRTSIVDLLKLLDLDSSLTARKELAAELGVNAGEAGSAEQNIALHKVVMRKLAENGGVVPASLRD